MKIETTSDIIKRIDNKMKLLKRIIKKQKRAKK